VVLGHTAFRNLVPRYANEAVLIVGSGHSVDAARAYGFKNTITTAQLMRAMPAAVPFANDAGAWVCVWLLVCVVAVPAAGPAGQDGPGFSENSGWLLSATARDCWSPASAARCHVPS
jgi:hypothetical protein